MSELAYLMPGDDFPPTSAALKDPDGLLAVGGRLDASTLLNAYRRGIFPWYEKPQPVLWWTPNPRALLLPQELHISRSLRKRLRSDAYALAVDCRFSDVMRACAAPRNQVSGTWIDDDMLKAYSHLHRLGHAHSIEILDRGGSLVGGLYGVALGGIFFGESMFSRVTDASKIALVALAHIGKTAGLDMIDCQVQSAHLKSMGARTFNRLDFESRLAHTVNRDIEPGIWRLPASCGALL